MDEQQQWYVTIAGNAVGPVSTDLVLRGIRHKKIATGAYVCVVGASEWLALTDVPEFHGALRENGLLPAITEAGPLNDGASEPVADGSRISGVSSIEEDDETETTSQFSSRRLMDFAQAPETTDASHDDPPGATHVALLASPPESDALHDDVIRSNSVAHVSSAPAPTQSSADDLDASSSANGSTYASGEDSSTDTGEVAATGAAESTPPSQPRNGKHSAALEGHAPGIEVEIDVHISVDEPEAPAIDWNHGFSDYFLVDADVTLPDEQLLLHSLTTTPHDTFLHDEPMWNLALCLAFGSNAVASVAADVFFDVVTAHAQHERIEWMARTLLSRGFMPSGIPHAAGNQGIGRLRQACPDELRMQLESQLGI